jgi:hypothetical protein
MRRSSSVQCVGLVVGLVESGERAEIGIGEGPGTLLRGQGVFRGGASGAGFARVTVV